MIDAIVDTALSSKPLTFGVVLLVVSIVLSVLNGLIDIAIYIASFLAFVLISVGVLEFLFPGVIPI